MSIAGCGAGAGFAWSASLFGVDGVAFSMLAVAAFIASVTACRLTVSLPTTSVSSIAYAGLTQNVVIKQSVSAVVHFLIFKEGHVLPLSG